MPLATDLITLNNTKITKLTINKQNFYSKTLYCKFEDAMTRN